MVWRPMSFIPPQIENASGTPYSGAVLKAYAEGTTTPISMATNSTGATTATSFPINANGNVTSGGAVIIPHVEQNYKLALYPTQAAADANSGAIWTYDSIKITGFDTPATTTITATVPALNISAVDTDGTSNVDLAGSSVSITSVVAPAGITNRRIRVRVTGSNLTFNNGGGITVPNGASVNFNNGDIFTLVPTGVNTVRIEGIITASIQSFYGFKNRIINGAMVIDQRNDGASVAVTSSVYVLDRFLNYLNGSGRYSVQRVSDAPSGFSWSAKITVTTAVSPAASDYYAFVQPIEGFNVADLGFGAAGASPITLQFWVKSSLTGTFGGYLTGGQGFAFNYSIAAANTWEYKTVTIPGSVTGTWPKDQTLGLMVGFDLGTGTTNSISATGAWQTANPLGVTGATKLIVTNGATWQITGLQLEKGSVASAFDYRPYGVELNLCQRYCWQTNSGVSAAGLVGQSALTQAIMSVPTVVTMRVAPTLTNITNGAVDSISSVSVNGLIPDTLYPHSVRFAVTSASNIGTAAGQAAVLRGQVIRLDAEL